MDEHKKELLNHFSNVLRLPKKEATQKTKTVIEMEIQLDKTQQYKKIK